MPLYPPKRERLDPTMYEKVPVGDFVKGEIVEVQHEKEHKFSGQYAKVAEAIRFKFHIDGLSFGHYSPWMIFNTGEKSNLFNRFILPLVDKAKPDCIFDLKEMEGMRVKMVWVNNEKNPDYQMIQLILPLVEKRKVKYALDIPEEKTFIREPLAEVAENDDEEVQF